MVPLNIPETHSSSSLSKYSSSVLMIGMLPQALASYNNETLYSFFNASSSSMCRPSIFLLAVTTCLPFFIAALTILNASSASSISSTTTFISSSFKISFLSKEKQASSIDRFLSLFFTTIFLMLVVKPVLFSIAKYKP